MSLNIGELVGYIKLDHTGVGQGVRAAQQDMTRGMDQLARNARTQGEKAGKSAGDGMSGAFKGSVGKLTGIVAGAFAVEKVVQGIRATKDAASDLNETTSMAGVIFGRSKAEMEDFAKTGPKALGLSTEATLRYSASLGDMLLQLGFTEEATTKLSKATLQQAADLGSFKNLQTSDVLERINASLRGEYDSLQLLIPNINAARVNQEAMAATGKKNADALTAQEKATATLTIIQQDGARASGDFARTRNGEANASKTAAAATEDLKAKIGQGLLPAYTTMVVFGRDQVIPFLSATVDKLGEAADATKPLTDGVGSLVSTFRDMPQPVQNSTIALLALVALRSRVEALGTGIQTKVTTGAKGAAAALDTMRLHMMYAADDAGSAGTRFTGMAKAIGTSAGAGVRGAASGLVSILGGPWGIAFAGAVTVVSLFLDKQAQARKVADDLRASLDQQTGAVTENTRVKLAQKLQEEGLLDTAGKLGLSMQDVTEAAAGNTAKLEELRKKQQDLANEGFAAVAGQQLLGDQFKLGEAGAVDFGKGLGTASLAAGDQAAQLQRILTFITPLNSALRTQSGQTKQVADAAGVAAGATQDYTTATKDATNATDDSTTKLKDQEEAARDAAKAVLDLAEAQLRASGETIAYQDALAAVGERLQKRKELEAELAKAGGRSDRTAKLERNLSEATDPKKRAKLERDLAESRSKDAKKSSDEIARLRKELKEYAGGLDLTTEAGRENQKILNDLAESARSKAEADLNAGASLKDLRKGMADAKADFIDSAVKLGVNRTKAEEMATQFGLTKKGVDNLAASVKGLPASKQIKIEAETRAAATALSKLKTLLAGIKDKTVVVTAQGRFVDNRSAGNGRGASTGGGITINEDGGFYPGGARMFSPNEGIKHVFNEPAAGGESFVPHAPSKRPQALGVLAKTAELFGMALAPKSVSNSNKTTIIHRGNVIAADPMGYAESMRQKQAHDALTEL